MLEFFYPYLLGLLSILSPCTFLIVPVMLSETRLRFVRITKFLLGVTITFCMLGIVAALTGKLMVVFIGPYLFIAAGIITLIASLNMAEVIELQIPYLFPKKEHSNSFIMGLLFGGIALSCVGASLGAVLAYVATRQSVLYGILTMLVFSLGLATPFLVLGLVVTNKNVSKRIIKKSGIIRKIGSVLLFLVSIYLILAGIKGAI